MEISRPRSRALEPKSQQPRRSGPTAGWLRGRRQRCDRVRFGQQTPNRKTPSKNRCRRTVTHLGKMYPVLPHLQVHARKQKNKMGPAERSGVPILGKNTLPSCHLTLCYLPSSALNHMRGDKTPASIGEARMLAEPQAVSKRAIRTATQHAQW